MLMVTFVQSDVKIYLCVQARGGFSGAALSVGRAQPGV